MQMQSKILLHVLFATLFLFLGVRGTSAQTQALAFTSLEQEVQATYLAYYARSGDPAGVAYWADRLITQGGNLEEIIAAFANSDEAIARYGDKTNAEVVDMLYQQLYGRAADEAGKAFYLDLLDSGASTRERVALDILHGTMGSDVDVLSNKLLVSDYFTEQVATSGAGYDTTTLDENIAILDDVDASADSVETARQAVDAYIVSNMPTGSVFERIATFPIYMNLGEGEDPTTETAAEITTVSNDGNTLLYTDSPMERLGLIDITNPADPQPLGFVALSGEPTSVAVDSHYALVGVNTSQSFTNPSGHLSVIDVSDTSHPTIMTTIDLGGQPDSVTVSADGQFASVAIENERDENACADGTGGLIDAAHGDEDACETLGGVLGGIPQLPAGHLSIIKLTGTPDTWTAETVDLTGLAEVAPSDPEPEYVDINSRNRVAVTLQENNHLAVVDLATRAVLSDFSMGTVSLTEIDAVENDLIDLIHDLDDIPREPDAVTWINADVLATANEGDYDGGSRGFTTFTPEGEVLFDSAEFMEYEGARIGQYPEFRAENKGVEPEGVEAGVFGGSTLLFVGAERANFVEVFAATPYQILPRQILPTGVGPEGLLAIPERDLFVVSAEQDAAGDGIRSNISIFQYVDGETAHYPQIESAGEVPIGWGALSALAADRTHSDRLYTVHDSFYVEPRFYTVDLSEHPAFIVAETPLSNDDDPLDYDLEGLVQRTDGSFWATSEGKPEIRPNLLIEIAADGTVEQEITLPTEIAANMNQYGFEGVAVIGSDNDEQVFVAVQREWDDDPEGFVKIGRYLPASGTWNFYYYPLETASEGTWIGLSEIVALDEIGTFAVIERDNQQGPAAKIKRIYQISLTGLTDQGMAYPVFAKTLLRDLLPDLEASNGWTPDKVEGLTVAADGNVYVVTDNDGIDDAVGETYFLRLGPMADAFTGP